MPQRQLNIRSDEAVARAAALAERLGKTTTDVIVEALRVYEDQVEPRGADGLTAQQRRAYDSILAAAREAAKHKPPGLTSNHDWLYDENGLPT